MFSLESRAGDQRRWNDLALSHHGRYREWVALMLMAAKYVHVETDLELHARSDFTADLEEGLGNRAELRLSTIIEKSVRNGSLDLMG